jgi:hypothetical protein
MARLWRLDQLLITDRDAVERRGENMPENSDHLRRAAALAAAVAAAVAVVGAGAATASADTGALGVAIERVSGDTVVTPAGSFNS